LGPAGLAQEPVRKQRANRFRIEIARLFSAHPVMPKKRATASDEKRGNCPGRIQPKTSSYSSTFPMPLVCFPDFLDLLSPKFSGRLGAGAQP
jgi:hypothetical protein